MVVTWLGIGKFAKPTFADHQLYPVTIMLVASVVVALLLNSGHKAANKSKESQIS